MSLFRYPALISAVRALPCMRCGAHGVQAAHSNLPQHGKGKATKASDAAIAALCPACHGQLDQGRELTRTEREALTFEAIASTYIYLTETGRLTVAKTTT